MSESLPFVDVLVQQMDPNGKRFINNVVRAALHALIAHCRADRTGKQNLPVAAPAPASASARAEAMRTLRDLRAEYLRERTDLSANALSAAACVVINLPEPDECAGLRELLAVVHEYLFDSEDDADRDHPKQVGMRLAWNMVAVEIRRLIAERGGKP